MHAVGEAGELGVLGIGSVGIVDHPDFTAAAGDRDLAVRHHLDSAGFEDHTLGNLETEDGVVIVLGGQLDLAARLCQGRNNEQ